MTQDPKKTLGLAGAVAMVGLNITVVASFVLWLIADSTAIGRMESESSMDPGQMLPNSELMWLAAHGSVLMVVVLDVLSVAWLVKMNGIRQRDAVGNRTSTLKGIEQLNRVLEFAPQVNWQQPEQLAETECRVQDVTPPPQHWPEPPAPIRSWPGWSWAIRGSEEIFDAQTAMLYEVLEFQAGDDHPNVLVALGWTRWTARRGSEAMMFLDQALAINPDRRHSHLQRPLYRGEQDAERDPQVQQAVFGTEDLQDSRIRGSASGDSLIDIEDSHRSCASPRVTGQHPNRFSVLKTWHEPGQIVPLPGHGQPKHQQK